MVDVSYECDWVGDPEDYPDIDIESWVDTWLTTTIWVDAATGEETSRPLQAEGVEKQTVEQTGVLQWFAFPDDGWGSSEYAYRITHANGFSDCHGDYGKYETLVTYAPSLVRADEIDDYVSNGEKILEVRNVTVTDYIEYACKDVSGVGRTLAERLADEFGDVEAVKSATEEELTDLEGIGPKRAAELVSAFDNS